MKYAIAERIDMPDYLASILITILYQNNGKLSKRAIEKEFSLLSQEECGELERLYGEIFGDAVL